MEKIIKEIKSYGKPSSGIIFKGGKEVLEFLMAQLLDLREEGWRDDLPINHLLKEIPLGNGDGKYERRFIADK